MNRHRRVACGAGIGAVLVAGGLGIAVAGAAAAELPNELLELRAAMERYKDPVQAIHDGYFSTLGCVYYEEGGMGVHFLNLQLIGPEPDPMAPPILVYAPDGEGKLELVAVEWFVPLATGVEGRPELFGRPFDGPMAGHVPLMPAELHHYDLHAWIFKDNPAGLFNSTNPEVDCAGWAYPMLEEHPPEVPHN